jgi:hypothetical protein
MPPPLRYFLYQGRYYELGFSSVKKFSNMDYGGGLCRITAEDLELTNNIKQECLPNNADPGNSTQPRPRFA